METIKIQEHELRLIYYRTSLKAELWLSEEIDWTDHKANRSTYISGPSLSTFLMPSLAKWKWKRAKNKAIDWAEGIIKNL